MPCRHGIVDWWDCSECDRQKEIDTRRRKVENRKEQELRELAALCELKKIRGLLEWKERCYE